jgi:hypothetical protein
MPMRLGRLLLGVAVLLVMAGPVSAATVDEIATALQQDPVYVEPDAQPGLTAEEADRLRQEIEALAPEAGPIRVAVVGEGTMADGGGNAEVLTDRLADAAGPATYAVVADGSFRATARGTREPQEVAKLADEAFAAHSDDGVAATLADFIRRAGGSTPSDEGGDSGWSIGSILVPLLLVGAAALFVRSLLRRRSRAARPVAAAGSSFGDVRALAEGDVADLDREISALEPQATAAGAPRAAGEDLRAAAQARDRAQEALRRVRGADDLAAVSQAVEEGRYDLTSARARLSGQEPPARRPPCVFDPRHGPSVRDVEWAPDGAEPRMVPACALDAARVERGEEPETREVDVAGRRMSYFNAPSRFGPYSGGFFGGFGGPALLGGLLGGMMLGGLLAPDSSGAAEGADGGDTGDGGDYGGGDWGGGGDFGGGDFGGGDF